MTPELQLWGSNQSNDTARECIAIYAKLQEWGHTPYTLLAKHGKVCTPSLKPLDTLWGRRGECFKNAMELANLSGLTYVEGYATGVIPTHHAWCIDKDGNVVDNTWRTLGSSYFGIPMDTNYVIGVALKTRMYSIFWNHRNRELIDLRIEQFHSTDFAIDCS